MKKWYGALAFASLALLAACSRPQFTDPDPQPVYIGTPAQLQQVGGSVEAALRELGWKTLQQQPGHLVVQLNREQFNLSIKLDITYTPSQVTIKFLEMVSLNADPIDDIQIGQYHRWMRNLRQAIVTDLNVSLGGTQAAY
jgi:hypothetical protein